MRRKLLLILFVVAVLLGVVIKRFPGSFMLLGGSTSKFGKEAENVTKVDEAILQEQKIEDRFLTSEKTIELEKPIQSEEVKTEETPQSSLLENVPFTSQAPFGEWHIATFQNGCEEAALVMASHWLSGKLLTKEIAKEEIMALTRFEDKKHGQSVDTSATDTEKIFREYYNVATSEVWTDIVLTDIQETLASGALVIVPMDGRKLHNPNYTQPGPTTHMLVVIGYDAEKKEFITNDSGTRKGQGYRYDENILYEAIRDYPTGNHLPIVGIHKDMIVVRRM